MSIILIILLVLAGIVVLLLLLALFMRKDYDIRREVMIDAPSQKVFAYVKQLRNQDQFNKWVMADPDMKRTFRGTDGTVGFVYGWNGNNKVGEGEQEIKAITEEKSMETEIRFVRPFASIAHASLTTEAVSATQTRVIWSNTSKMKYPMNAMLPTIEKMLAKDMDTSLAKLKAILEEDKD